ncbi:uncharacterized protein LOC129601707 [Paramacrobiotus metropolitanus]|uniref:uncharacterized protein LOC129601707 n=1 Tax=Paramacrobiotus metropolitanus TaxID=2943436 RepID=UPI0024463A25|nr:uncharacterized protein LOC129601707 [Paramacrobiotus metropolitanus]XP_055356550.1 uncharacterized protein LOC129601707 [Paramacrobiotus metropolitanus]XP_055356551.1 uncharacterized protein LOC129601707 [Paramacrobiotus metropolitanus]
MYNGIRSSSSVDVLTDDHQLRYGRVVDVTDKGLHIDFLHRDQRREFIPFHRVFRCSTTPPLDAEHLATAYAETSSSVPVEVLQRKIPSGAWTWCPADIINLPGGTRHNAYGVAIVKGGKDGECMDIVPVERLRWRVGSGWWAQHGRPASLSNEVMRHLSTWPSSVLKGTFAKRCIKAPTSSVPAEHLLKILNSSTSVPFVEVVTGYVWYIQLEDLRWADPPLAKLQKEFLDSVPRMICELTTPLVDCGVNEELNALPTELWRETFSHLGTCTQNRLRLVCATWDLIVDSPSLTANIVVSSAEFDAKQPDRFVYYLTAPIFKCLRPSSQRLIVCDRRRLLADTDVFKVLDMLQYVGQETSNCVRLKALYLVGVHCRLRIGAARYDACEIHQPGTAAPTAVYVDGNRSFFRLDYFITSCRQIACDYINFVNCSVHLDYTFFDDKTVYLHLKTNIHTAGMKVDSDFGCAMWSALEAGLPVSTSTEPPRLASWLTVVNGLAAKFGTDFYDREMCKMLCVSHTADPRPSLHYREKRWCVDGWKEMQLKNLSRVALCFISAMQNNFLSEVVQHIRVRPGHQ